MQFSDENTKYFHAMASERHRRNVISQIVDYDGRMVFEQSEKSALFHKEFRNRLGCIVPTDMHFDFYKPCIDFYHHAIDLKSIN